MKFPKLPVPHAPSRRTIVAAVACAQVVTVAVATKLGAYPLAAGAATSLVALSAYLAGKGTVKK